jgi:hypothetical protein
MAASARTIAWAPNTMIEELKIISIFSGAGWALSIMCLSNLGSAVVAILFYHFGS